MFIAIIASKKCAQFCCPAQTTVVGCTFCVEIMAMGVLRIGCGGHGCPWDMMGVQIKFLKPNVKAMGVPKKGQGGPGRVKIAF